ncbi:MAG: 3-oxoacyl-ACP reductase FabG [Anaerolineae bacterium]|nr:3-oxoacyl-ACP reductase FabG [Anaerolineae bacterium]NIN99398.1 3-oxoacyl-ACP reductase FabG [Anaerolineae bacterium]NIQ82263.1 3-oxoacyl-ACP reductase FabG [Anaerolineae bacterium]
MILREKIAVVTGAGQGIGRGIAVKLAEKGADVIVSDINEQTARQTAKEVKALGSRTLAVEVDVAQRSQVEKMVSNVVAEFGKIDILVNNAGIARSATLLKLTDEAWDEVLDVNLKGVFYTTQAVAPHMIDARYGKIINISSIYGRTGAVGDSNYVASKAGIVGFTKSVARELARHNINVNAILPGMVDTPLLQGIPDEYLRPMIKEIPLRRVGTPEDIGHVAAFLASDEASYITGATIEVTGGWRM